MTQQTADYIPAPVAKRLILRWANHFFDPEFVLRQSEVAKLSGEKRERLYVKVGSVGRLLRTAFRASDLYIRDWILFLARYHNASETVGAQLGEDAEKLRARYVVMARHSEMDRAIWFVQSKLANRMAVCKRKHCENPCFFRTRKGQMYCTRACARTVLLANKRRWHHESPHSRKNRPH